MNTQVSQIYLDRRRMPMDDIRMSNFEFLKRKESICVMPFVGLTIGPTGMLTLCCNSANYSLGHISKIEDLNDFYNGPVYNKIRNQMQRESAAEVDSCRWCYSRYQKGLKNHAYIVNHYWTPFFENDFDKDWTSRQEGQNSPVRFLEFTGSNTCNQACSTCTSFYSSKWQSLEAKFHTDRFIMTPTLFSQKEN